MKGIKKFITVISLLLVGSFAFADDWFVCVGSYSTAANANELVTSLENKGISSFIYEVTKDDGAKLFRVLVNEGFDSRDKARISRDKLENNAAIKALRLSGLWICQAQAPAPAPVVIEEVKPVVEAPVEEPAPAEEANPSEYIKVVLEWKNTVLDLDTVVLTSSVFIDYDNPEEDGIKLVVSEDEDYAPETIYISDLKPGEEYSYYVQCYNPHVVGGETVIANSGASVTLYANGDVIAVFDVTPEEPGHTWHVFDITPEGNIRAVDEMSDEELYE